MDKPVLAQEMYYSMYKIQRYEKDYFNQPAFPVYQLPAYYVYRFYLMPVKSIDLI